MTIKDLGYNDSFEKLRKDNNLEDFEIGRVIAEHKERYIVKNEKGEFEAEITGNLRFTAKNRADFPVVGDWVALLNYDSDFAIIHSVIPRISILTRQAVGKFGETQIIATNIDFALLVQAVDRDFNINRLERYLTICYSSKVSPIIVLTKTDLIAPQNLNEIVENIKQRIKNVPILAISNETKDGYESLARLIDRGKTYCLLGSSGVGKSTLMNNLSGKSLMKTNSLSKSTNKGRHVTSHRELTITESGAILIDNPGMREVGIADSANGLETAFDTITKLSKECRFKDCSHTTEIDCAVLLAIANEELEESAYLNYLKIAREKEHFESSVVEKRTKDKALGKIVKDMKMKNIRNKY